jgi:hypothetical protein
VNGTTYFLVVYILWMFLINPSIHIHGFWICHRNGFFQQTNVTFYFLGQNSFSTADPSKSKLVGKAKNLKLQNVDSWNRK